MRGIKDRLTAAVIVIVGMALIRTNAEPALWQMAFLSIGLYEAILLFVYTSRTIKKENSKRKIKNANAEADRKNKENLSKFWLGWPMREVSGR